MYTLLLLETLFSFAPVWGQAIGIRAPDPIAHADAVMFYLEDCTYCQSAKTVVEAFERQHPRIRIAWIEGHKKNADTARARLDRTFGVSRELSGEVPAFFGGSGILIRHRFTLSALRATTRRSLSAVLEGERP